jgi:hypothetical protein
LRKAGTAARSLADGVVFELGLSWNTDLELRTRIRRCQSQLRALFLMRAASLKYRLQAPGFELPKTVRLWQEAYDDAFAQILEQMADRIETSRSRIAIEIQELRKVLNGRLPDADVQVWRELPAKQAESFGVVLHSIRAVTDSLAVEIAPNAP